MVSKKGWYRLCPGGIYTQTNAYIDTGYKNFTNRNFEFEVDVKVLRESTAFRCITGADITGSNGAYNNINFTQKNSTTYGENTFRAAHETSSTHIANFNQLKPFFNKKIKFIRPKNQTGYYCSIQEYIGDILGEKIYSNYEYIERQDLNCPYSIYIFAGHRDNAIYYSSNDIVVYGSSAKQNDVLVYSMTACQLTKNITGDLSWDNKPHSSGEYGMYDEVSGKFFGNANSSGYFLENTETPDLFRDAYFYLPFKEAQTVIDVNNGISPSVNSGTLTSEGYYTDGVNQGLEYNDSRLINAINDNDSITTYIELTPYELSRNQYLLDIGHHSSPQRHLAGLFIYKAKNNKFSYTLSDNSDSTTYLDDELYNSPVVTYGDTYKICTKYNKSTGVFKCFINGALSEYTGYYYNITPVDILTIGKHAWRTDRYAKATFKAVAVWDKELTDEDCSNLTI